jgi:hypothetical protein
MALFVLLFALLPEFELLAMVDFFVVALFRIGATRKMNTINRDQEDILMLSIFFGKNDTILFLLTSCLCRVYGSGAATIYNEVPNRAQNHSKFFHSRLSRLPFQSSGAHGRSAAVVDGKNEHNTFPLMDMQARGEGFFQNC